MTKNWRKKHSWNFFPSFLNKNCNLLLPRLSLKDVQATVEAFSPQKRTSSTSKMKFMYIFFYLCGPVLPSWIQSGEGSGSKTLVFPRVPLRSSIYTLYLQASGQLVKEWKKKSLYGNFCKKPDIFAWKLFDGTKPPHILCMSASESSFKHKQFDSDCQACCGPDRVGIQTKFLIRISTRTKQKQRRNTVAETDTVPYGTHYSHSTVFQIWMRI